MAVVMKGGCDEVDKSTCLHPQFPSWTWRFNRNQHMTHYYPWQTREEQWHPNYRNMGMHRDFRFHPMGPNDGPRPFLQLGVNLCQDLVQGRQAGFGNSALGRTPGPAPPRLFAYGQRADDFYRINEINNISPGVSLFGYQQLPDPAVREPLPLNPSHYLENTLGQVAAVPGSFPHFNKELPTNSRHCGFPGGTGCGPLTFRDPLAIWTDRFHKQQEMHAVTCCRRACPSSYSGGGNQRPSFIGRDRPRC